MVNMTNTQATIFALVPGVSERAERVAHDCGNIAWLGATKRVTWSRNSLYTGMALTTIGVLANVPFAVALATIGGGLSLLSAKRLYVATSFVQDAVNSRKDS
jgi:hypothetical protein